MADYLPAPPPGRPPREPPPAPTARSTCFGSLTQRPQPAARTRGRGRGGAQPNPRPAQPTGRCQGNDPSPPPRSLRGLLLPPDPLAGAGVLGWETPGGAGLVGGYRWRDGQDSERETHGGGRLKNRPRPATKRDRDALGAETEGETQARERKERTWGRQRPPEGEGTAEGRRGGEEGPEWERERKDLRPRAPERKDQGQQGGAGRGKLVKINIYKLRVSQFFLHFRSKLCISYLLRETPRQGRGGSFLCSPHFPPHPPPLPLSSPPPPHVLPSLLFPSYLPL